MRITPPIVIASWLLVLSYQPVLSGDVLSVARANMGQERSASYIRIRLEQFDIRVLSPFISMSGGKNTNNSPERMARGFFLRDYMRRYDTDAVSSGGYIDSYSPPTSLGFVKSDWVRVSPPHESWLTEALFCSDDNRVSIDFMEQSKEGAGFRDCVQAGPLLLKKGLPPSGSSAIAYQKLARAVQEQTFICIDGFGQAVIGVTDKTDLVGLTAFLRRPEIGCVDAMRLTGLDTAGMRVGSKLFGRDDYLFPNALGVIRRK